MGCPFHLVSARGRYGYSRVVGIIRRVLLNELKALLKEEEREEEDLEQKKKKGQFLDFNVLLTGQFTAGQRRKRKRSNE